VLPVNKIIGFELQPLQIGLLVAIAIFAAIFVTGRVFLTRLTMRRNTMTRSDGVLVGPSSRPMPHDLDQQRASKLLERVARFVAPTDKTTLSTLRRELVQAGYFNPNALAIFFVWRMVAVVGLPVVLVAASPLLSFAVPAGKLVWVAAALAGIGIVLPPIVLDFLRSGMQKVNRMAFPDVMDLLVVCVEAGQSLPTAINSVAKEMMQIWPKMGANLHLVFLELRAGSTLQSALQGLADRLGIEEVQSLATLLKQSEELGTSIAGTLRVYSDEMRDKRMLRAESKANSLPVKMTIPLGLFIFPCVLLVIIVPLAIRIKSALM